MKAAHRSEASPQGDLRPQIALRIDQRTYKLLRAAADAEEMPRMATYLRLAVRTHVLQSSHLPAELKEELAASIGGPFLFTSRI